MIKQGHEISKCDVKLVIFRVEVLGVDLSAAAIELAQERSPPGALVKFSVQNIMDADFPAQSFEVVFSRDVLIYAKSDEKLKLLKKIHKWLKPNGRLLLIDFTSLKKSCERSQEYKNFLKKRSYNLATIEEYSAEV